MKFKIVGKISNVEIIAVGSSIKEIARLRKNYGKGRWRKLKGVSKVQFADGDIVKVEIHWYEAHGIGKKEFKIKKIISD